MVIPRSRSMSIRSRYCARAARSSTTPVSWSIRSARVDLPWSMWAMMQKLRMIAGAVRPGCGAGVVGTETTADSRWVRDPPIVPSGARNDSLGGGSVLRAGVEKAGAEQRLPQRVPALHGPADGVVVVAAHRRADRRAGAEDPAERERVHVLVPGRDRRDVAVAGGGLDRDRDRALAEP